ncbi:hypothetical protein BKI52_42625 [marine bacterium AO1-C]|nr:hypothetical protein BKI52_42625 [marine bacterium AO1-C]
MKFKNALLFILWLSSQVFLTVEGQNLQKTLKEFPSLKEKPAHQVLVLGSFHFNRKRDGSDVISKNHLNISSKENQKQIQELVSKLKKFRPTIIAIEWRPKRQKLLDSLYLKYKKGQWKLGKHESFQLGFRLAKMFNHDKLYAVDNRPPQLPSVNKLEDIEKYAASLNQTKLLHAYDAANKKYNGYLDNLQTKMYVKDYLLLLNSPVNTVRSKQLWLTGLVNLGVGDSYVGADLTGHWFQRNTRIFVNIRHLAKKKSERILVIYGNAHKWILDELFQAAPDFKVRQLGEFVK